MLTVRGTLAVGNYSYEYEYCCPSLHSLRLLLLLWLREQHHKSPCPS